MEKWKDRKNTGIIDMNVEKLREVGQKLGYEGKELNEFVEEQLAYQLEEERLEADEREAQQLHEEWMEHWAEEGTQIERKPRELEASEQLQDLEGFEQSHMEGYPINGEQQFGVEECSGRTDGEFMTSNLDGANAGVWVNTTVDSTKGKWSGMVVHNPWGAKEQPQYQEGIG